MRRHTTSSAAGTRLSAIMWPHSGAAAAGRAQNPVPRRLDEKAARPIVVHDHRRRSTAARAVPITRSGEAPSAMAASMNTRSSRCASRHRPGVPRTAIAMESLESRSGSPDPASARWRSPHDLRTARKMSDTRISRSDAVGVVAGDQPHTPPIGSRPTSPPPRRDLGRGRQPAVDVAAHAIGAEPVGAARRQQRCGGS